MSVGKLREKDPVTDTETTGHEWDGVKELDTPVPWAVRWSLWISIVVAIGYWLLYPAFPVGSDFTRGLLGYSSRNDVLEAVAEGQTQRDAQFAVFLSDDIVALAEDPTLEDRFAASIAPLFTDNCAACHRQDLKGQTNFPNLTDDHWLWSSEPDEVELTIRYGINADHLDTRYAEMRAFGRDEILSKQEIVSLTDYVLSLSGMDHDRQSAVLGEVIFAENCTACHGEEGIGGLETGAPALTDDQWIYGNGRDDIHSSIFFGRQRVMPAWEGKLSDSEISMLTLYVQWAGDD